MIHGNLKVPKEANSVKEARESFLRRSRSYLEKKDLADTCEVKVDEKDHWLVLRGKVDSHGTRGKLLAMVPKIKGAQWVIDRLRVGKKRRH